MSGNGLRNTISKNLWKFFHCYKEFLVLIGAMVLAISWVISSEKLPISACLFKTVTGYPCPGWGGTRAAYALMHGDWLDALLINPLSCLLILFYILMLVWSIWDGYKRNNTLYRFLTKQWNTQLLIFITVIILAIWIWNIYKGL